MQEPWANDPEIVASLKRSLSAPRFNRYLVDAKEEEKKALALYQWNVRLSQSLYVYIQCWEVCLRNTLDQFLRWKFSVDWPYDEPRAVRQLKGNDKTRLADARRRQEADRETAPVTTDVIVADLSAGFWVSLLAGAYDVPFVWRHNLKRIFPHEPRIARADAHALCDRALTLRNRVAHHEPVYHLDLAQEHANLRRIVRAMCPGTFAFAEENCSFMRILEQRPP